MTGKGPKRAPARRRQLRCSSRRRGHTGMGILAPSPPAPLEDADARATRGHGGHTGRAPAPLDGRRRPRRRARRHGIPPAPLDGRRCSSRTRWAHREHGGHIGMGIPPAPLDDFNVIPEHGGSAGVGSRPPLDGHRRSTPEHEGAPGWDLARDARRRLYSAPETGEHTGPGPRRRADRTSSPRRSWAISFGCYEAQGAPGATTMR